MKITDYYYIGEDEIHGDYYECPKCIEAAVFTDFKFCPHCGISLEWDLMTDEEKEQMEDRLDYINIIYKERSKSIKIPDVKPKEMPTPEWHNVLSEYQKKHGYLKNLYQQQRKEIQEKYWHKGERNE